MKPRAAEIVKISPVALDESDAGPYMGISPREVKRLRDKGWLPYLRLGANETNGGGRRGSRKIVYRRDHLDQLIRRWPLEGGDRFFDLLKRRTGGKSAEAAE